MVNVVNYTTVKLVDSMGTDESLCHAARVSTLGSRSIDTGGNRGLLNFLMKNRHGTPFEHGAMTFLITAPIFVWREFMRHRIGFSYNEESGRYRQLEPNCYIPPADRALVQVGKPGEYTFEAGTPEQVIMVWNELDHAYDTAFQCYETMLRAGIAREVARMCLPVATMSSAYVTCNPRSLMSFLSLRTKDPSSTFKSYPQQEIDDVARQMEAFFRDLYPITHEVFHENGRVSP